MKVICDTSSLIRLRKGGAIDCLGRLFSEVLIPQAVYQECQDLETKAALQKSFFTIHTVARLLALPGIQKGEQEAISLAVERSIQVLLPDDERAFKKAVEQGLTPIRSFHVLLLAKQKGIIPSVKAVLDAMIAGGEGSRDDLYQDVLKAAGEAL